MGKIHDILRLIRVKQWYKGIVVFAGLFFGGKIFQPSNYPPILLGFLVICLVSSVNYIINDLIDLEKDKHHKEKCLRPIASGAISKKLSITLGVFLFFLAFFLSTFVMNFLVPSTYVLRFNVFVIAVFVTGSLYNFGLKRIAFVDIVTLSVIYIWRTMAGCYLLNIEFSPWLHLMIFQIAMFLSIGKRKADKEFCGEDAVKHKEIYKKYTDEVIRSSQNLITVSLFMTYSLYCVLGEITGFAGPELSNNRGFMLFSIPVMMYIIMRFLYLANTKPHIARSPERAVTDKPLVIAGLVLAVLIFIGNYWKIEWFI
ncbi:MAG: hypothetical protein GF364_08870 [Candidatus Lokiarchaeota archaeon]|nr:hypothetical protein [Candidatus Lokiarchaeota archaeon]